MKNLLFIAAIGAALTGCQKQTSTLTPAPTTTEKAAAVAPHPAQPASASTISRAYDGPFGLASGIPADELERMDFKPDESRPGIYRGTPPKPFDSATDYSVVATPKAGVCRVQTTVDVGTVNGSGDQMRAAVDRIADMMRVKYGKQSHKYTYAREDVYDRNPQFWMMGLKEDSVVYTYEWTAGKTERELPGNLETIQVSARTASLSSGWVLVQYTFKNFQTCLDELKAKKAESL